MKTFLLPTLCAALMCGCDAQERAAIGLAGATVPAPAVTATNPPTKASAGPDSKPTAIGTDAGTVALPKPPPELPAPVQEVVQLAQNTLGEQVLLDFVQTLESPFVLNADQVIYLKDLGIPETVIAALLKRQVALGGPAEPLPTEAADTNAVAAAAEPKLALTNAPGANVGLASAPVVASATPNAPVYGEAPGQPQPAAQPAVVEQPTQVNYNVFYQSLSPYGTWVEVADYGWCWQPTVATINVGWRPYCDNGRWVWSTSGWYWNSYYSWGWAPFHYGRWCSVPSRGWCWVPGTVWGPSWVSWRHTHDHFGWAPLPPACGWAAGVGLTWHGSGVSVGFSFGLAVNDYCFVPRPYFYDPHCYRYRVGGPQVTQIYQNSTVVNNYINGNNNTVIINNGVGRDVVQKFTREEIRPVALADARAPRPGAGTISGRGSERLEVYRPRVVSDQQATRPPATILARQEARPRPAAIRSGPTASPTSSAVSPATNLRQELRPGDRTTATSARPSGLNARPGLGNQLPQATPANNRPGAPNPRGDVLSDARPGVGGNPAVQLHGRSEARPAIPGSQASGTTTSPATRPGVADRNPAIRPAVPPGSTVTRPQTQPAPVTMTPNVSRPVAGRSEATRPQPQEQISVRRDTPAQIVRPIPGSQSSAQPGARPNLSERYTPPAASVPQSRPASQFQAPAQPSYNAPAQVAPAPQIRAEAPRSIPQYNAPAQRSYSAPQTVNPSYGGSGNRGGVNANNNSPARPTTSQRPQ